MMIFIFAATLALSIGLAAKIILDMLPSPPPEPISHVDLVRLEAKQKGFVLNRPAYMSGLEIYVPKKDEWKQIYSIWNGTEQLDHHLIEDRIIV